MMVRIFAIPARVVDWRDDGSALLTEDVTGQRWRVIDDPQDGTLVVESPSGGFTAQFEYPLKGDQGIILWD